MAPEPCGGGMDGTDKNCITPAVCRSVPRGVVARIPPEARTTGKRVLELLGKTPTLPVKESVLSGNMKPPTPEAREQLAWLIDRLWLDASDESIRTQDHDAVQYLLK